MKLIVAANSSEMLRVQTGGGSGDMVRRYSRKAFSTLHPYSTCGLVTVRAQPNKRVEDLRVEQEKKAQHKQEHHSASVSALEIRQSQLPAAGSQTTQTFEYEGSEPQFQFPFQNLGPAIEDALTA